jgi:hypothetical protein
MIHANEFILKWTSKIRVYNGQQRYKHKDYKPYKHVKHLEHNRTYKFISSIYVFESTI